MLRSIQLTTTASTPIGPTAAAVAAQEEREPSPPPRAVVNACSDVETRNSNATRGATHLYPKAMVCPITLEVFRDPVIAADGHSYERAALARWLSGHNTSPVTGATLASRCAMPNHALRVAVDEFTAAHCDTCT